LETASDFIDRWLTRLRWPIAIAALVMLPGIAWSLLRLLGAMLSNPWPLRYFAVGCAGWLAVWWLVLRRSRFSLLLTLEHELTHALFAWLTFHRVVGFRATLTRGGSMSLEGSGNFLITLAPYFFPTPAILLLMLIALLPAAYQLIPELMLGFAFGWHLTSTLRETHGGQTDIQRAGKLFSLAFLPPTGLFFAALVLSAAHGGISGMIAFCGRCLVFTIKIYSLPFAG